ncbi:MarR family winged helix-turn-helix transcriptional regulator [Streptomyces sp. NPDC090442]|uniref:MarR family winged helix-turn-helix transcriptional regulator n=1 Tax=Streptomyces sp. NPDC090442 TaxID=3365962 RepID=UPI00382A3561
MATRPDDDLLGQAQELTPALYAISRAMRQRLRGSPEVGLSPLPPAEFEVLRTVLDEPGISVGGLARRLGLHASNVSTIVRGLVGRGLLAREPDPADRRAVRLQPTPQSIADLRMIQQSWDGWFAGNLATLTEDQRLALTAALPALRALAATLKETQGATAQ